MADRTDGTEGETAVTGDDLKHMQDGFLDAAKKIIRTGRVRPVSFIVTMHHHLDKLAGTGWGVEFIDFKSCLRDDNNDKIAVLILDMLLDWKRLYFALIELMPKAGPVLEPMLDLANQARVDDPYMRVMRPFLAHMQMEEKDIVAGVVQQICGKLDAFASIVQSEAWMRHIDTATETVDEIYKNSPGGLGGDQKSVEVIVSMMETYEFSRMVTVPIVRSEKKSAQKRDGGKVTGFGGHVEHVVPFDEKGTGGRFDRMLKPLSVAS
jgi:hypothetical protein